MATKKLSEYHVDLGPAKVSNALDIIVCDASNAVDMRLPIADLGLDSIRTRLAALEEKVATMQAAFDDKFKDLGTFTTSSEGEAAMAEWENVFGAENVFFSYRATQPNARTAFAFQSINGATSYQCLYLAGTWYHRTVTANADKTTTATAWTAGIE